MPYIALTGGFGSGKSTVLGLFKRLGALTVDVDRIVHKTLRRAEIIRQITSLLGTDVIKRSPRGITLDKQAIADRIFDDIKMRRAIEGIIHPVVLDEIERIKSRRGRERLTIFEIPLLFEAGLDRYFDLTVAVYCDRGTVMKRLLKRGFNESEAIKRIKAQWPIEKKVMLADFIIDNSNGIKKTERQVKRVFNMITSALC
jgi:dephospho-CoA kinase